MTETVDTPATGGPRWRLMLGVILMVAALALMIFAPVLDWVRLLDAHFRSAGWLGIVGFCVVFSVWAVVLPAAPMQILASLIWGFWGGIALVYIGATLSMTGSFVLARWLAHDAIQRGLANRPICKAVEHAIVERGWRTVVLLRLSNCMPANLANLVLGCTRMPLFTVIWASWLGKFPGIVLMAVIGVAAKEYLSTGKLELGSFGYVMIGVGVLATVVLSVVVAKQARKVLSMEEPGLA